MSGHSPVISGTRGVLGSGQSGLAALRKQKRLQCGGDKNRKWRIVVQCEADGANGVENSPDASSHENGRNNGVPIASEVADAGNGWDSAWLLDGYALLMIRIRSILSPGTTLSLVARTGAT